MILLSIRLEQNWLEQNWQFQSIYLTRPRRRQHLLPSI